MFKYCVIVTSCVSFVKMMLQKVCQDHQQLAILQTPSHTLGANYLIALTHTSRQPSLVFCFPFPAEAIMSSTAETYQPQDAISSTIKTTLMTGAVGLFASSVQNTLQKRNYGPWGVITRTGGTIALFGMEDSLVSMAMDGWNGII